MAILQRLLLSSTQLQLSQQQAYNSQRFLQIFTATSIAWLQVAKLPLLLQAVLLLLSLLSPFATTTNHYQH
jgi:hypothetical protein